MLARFVLLLTLAPPLCLAGDSARDLAKKAQKAALAGDRVNAYLLYSQAAAADPKNSRYWTLAQAFRTRAVRDAKFPAQETPLNSDVSEEVPGVELVTLSNLDLLEARRPLPPKEFKIPAGAATRDFDLKGDARSLFQQLLKIHGIEVVFDADYPATTPLRFRLDQVDFQTALHSLQSATSSFVVPLSENVAFVAKDTNQKRAEAEPTVAVTLSLPGPFTVQEAQELARSVQQVMEIQRFNIDSGHRVVFLKDRISKVRAAQTLFEQLMFNRSQLLLEVELLDITRGRDLNFGAILPTSSAMSFLGIGEQAAKHNFFKIIPDFLPGFSRFLLAGSGFGTIAMAISDASAFANFTQTQSSSMFRTQLRALDGQAASVHIGDKYPITTQSFQGGAGVSAFAAPSTFTFEDLGLSLKITPRIHDMDEMSLQVEAEFKVLGAGSYNGIPVISNRKFASTVRLRNGQWAVLAGLINTSEAKSISGLALLGHVPLLSKVLTQNTRSKQSSEALVVIKTHLLDVPPTELATRPIYTGTEGRWATIR